MPNTESDYDSDESIRTEDMPELIERDEESVLEEGVEDMKGEDEGNSKRARKKRAPICEEKRMMASEAKDELKALRAQKRKDEREMKRQQTKASRMADKVVLQQKERVLYMVQGDDGKFLEMDPTEFTKSQLRAINQEKKNLKTELELGQKLPRLLNGKVKVPKDRSEKQKQQTARLVAANKARAEQRRLNKKAEADMGIQESVTRAVKDVLARPKRELEAKEHTVQVSEPARVSPSRPLKFF